MKIRHGQDETKLSETEFKARYRERFQDPNFEKVQAELDAVTEVAWKNYESSRKAPRTRKAGPGFADPSYDLSVDWMHTRERLQLAELRQKDPTAKSRVLVICCSPRNEHTCPGEIPKTLRLARLAIEAIEKEQGFECAFLDLSRLTAEFGKQIHPCKGCVSTAMPLCHWPCSCYPNHGLGQTQDWMADIYEQWVAAHGVLLITPVHWYQAPSVLKQMIDRLVCADGGNPDPSSTQGKDPKLAKKLELKGWDYPKHLKGRAFGIVAHGDTIGAEGLRRDLSDWLEDLELIRAGDASTIDRYIGYNEPYATSHDALDKDEAIQADTKNAAISVARLVTLLRSGKYVRPDAGLSSPLKK